MTQTEIEAPIAAPVPRYRFIVRSAEEAVTVIREQLGDSARVVEVRQVEGEGLARFLRSPKLEVTAEVPLPEPQHTVDIPEPEVEKPLPEARKTRPARLSLTSDEPATPREEIILPPQKPVAAMARTPRVVATPNVPAPVAVPVPRAVSARVAATPVSIATSSATPGIIPIPCPSPSTAPKQVGIVSLPETERLWSAMERAGLNWSTVAHMREQPGWQELANLPLSSGLARAGLLLRDTLAKTPVRPLTGKVAFFGTAGAGATTALCKQLVREVFFGKKPVCVMKLEGQRSNPCEGLAAFCEALNIPLLRTTEELAAVKKGTKIYYDMPSLSLAFDGNTELKQLFEEFEITTRVLVVNAAYDSELIKVALVHADSLKSRHIVYSHMDELTRWGKMWELVADPRRTTLFASTGQNLAGDCVRDVVDLLTQQTLQVLNVP